MRRTLSLMLAASVLCGALSAMAQPTGGPFYRVTDHGAAGDGITKDTSAIQAAMDRCAESGGGTVLVPAGKYLCGSLHLRSHVTLWLDNGATIVSSPDNDDFDKPEKLDFKNQADAETSYFYYATLWGEDLEHVAIVGEGTIDCNREKRHGPKAIALKRCAFVQIRGIHVLNCPNYNISLLGTDHVDIDGVTLLNGYADGIDPDACRNVRISNCHIESNDDCIVPKTSYSLGEHRSTENVTVTNCYLETEANGFKLGTESGGDFKRIAVSNCVISGRKAGGAGGGICLESVDGAGIDGVTVSNCTMRRVTAPIFLRLGNRARDMESPTPGYLRNVVISGIVATGAVLTCSLTGIPGYPLENVTIDNVRIEYASGAICGDEVEIPEIEKEYPDPDMFDALPAWAFYCRHVRGLRMGNIDLARASHYQSLPGQENNHKGEKLEASERAGHALVLDDVTGMDLDGFTAQPSPEGVAILRVVRSMDVVLRGCRALVGTRVFLDAAELAPGAARLIDLVAPEDVVPVALAAGLAQDAVLVRALD